MRPMADSFSLPAGREADVSRQPDGRLLRRYRDARDTRPEADLMHYLHQQGYPVPRVYWAVGRDLVMEFVEGPTMAEAALSGAVSQAESGAMLADLHDRLHAVAPRYGGPAIIHLDLHPQNVLLGPTGPVLIDWPNAQEGRPSLDVAMTAVILAQVSVGGPIGVDLDLSVMLAAFLTGCADDPRCSLDAALKLRSKNPTMRPQELARLDDARALIEDMAG